MLQGSCTLNEKRQVLEETLSYVNTIRTSSGSEKLSQLPAGVQWSSYDCVIARALYEVDKSVNVFQDSINTTDREFAKIIAHSFGYSNDVIALNTGDEIKRFAVPLPTEVKIFVENFDEGSYPKLVSEPAQF